jgi:hypothetical protein
MRAHGITSFPDPSFGPHGGVKAAASAGINRDAPAFVHANQACSSVGVQQRRRAATRRG